MFDYILHKANGIDKVELNQQIPTFRVVTSLLFEAEWQIEEKISLSIISATPLDFGIGDWIEYHGKKYQVFTNYSNSGLITDNRYTYKITFYSPERWYKKANMYNTSEIIDESQTSGYRWERVDNETVSNGDIVSLGNQLCYNLNASQERRVFKLGDVPEALIGVYKEFTFSDPNCLVCLHEICEAFDTFYNIRTNLVGDTDYVIDFGYEPGYFPVTLKYGKKQGLYSLKLNNADEEVYTIFVVRGSSENLPSTYPKLRLSLNDSYPDSVISCPEKFTRWGKSVKELTYEDVKPERTGEVTGIVPGNINVFVDTTLTFSPVGGTIKFLSGPMIGHTLECVGYNEITHTVTLKPYEDSNHFVIPNPDSEAYRINVGDKYNIDGIGLPQSYVTDAENRLLARPQKDIEYYSQPRASYDTRIERELIQEENVFPEIGMFVHIVHENLDIDKFLRVRRITQNILGTKPVYESFEVSDLEYQKADVRMYKKAVQAQLQAKKNKKNTDNAILFLKAFSIEKSTEAQVASQTYAAAQAEAARIAAEAYADGEIDAEEARAIADATAKMNEAKSYALAQAQAAESAARTYAEAQAAAAQSAAEAVAEAEAEAAELAASAYADGIVTAEEQRAIAEAASKLTEAKNYAESQASAAESAANTYSEAQAEAARLAAIASAKTYTDTEVTAAKGYADSTAAAAQSAAQAYALAKADLAKTNAEAYADGIVDAEEAARIAEAQAKLTEAKNYAESQATAAENAAKAYADTQLGNFATTVTGSLSDLQNQIDGSITTHFYAYVPTTANAPASGWTTTALKNQHLGDLFYNTATGFCYRYQLVGGVYSWQRITDSDVTKALADAAAAQDTADSKRRVFVATPVTPYDIGDLWLKSGDLYKCKVTRATGSYVASDWEKGVKYTDDTVANANLVTAKAYADTKKAEAIAAAEAAAEAEALAAQTAAEAHADGIVTAEEQARIADVNAKLATAKTYAETKASEAQTAAQNYAATAASNAQSAAQSYALSKANLAETTAKAYADGVVSDEETRAIADATAKMNDAKAHAETKATEAKNAAEAAAALDATAKANAAQSAAETYALAKANLAETTAKAYADGIVDAEEARAIADATAKANAAKAAAEATAAALDDAIQVGGRNLIIGSYNDWRSRTVLQYGYSILFIPIQDDWRGKSVTHSFEVKDIPEGESVRIRIDYYRPDNTYTTPCYGKIINLAGKSFVTYIVTTDTQYDRIRARIYPVNYTSDYNVLFRCEKLEFGNKPTDWTPAPEDVDADIDAADAAAAVAQSTANAAATAAAAAQTAANTANSLLSDLANDNKLTADEKQSTKKEWDAIVSEKTKIDTQADTFSVSKTAYGTAYNNLSSYITPLLSNLTTTSDITGTTFRSTFKAYYDARTDLLNAIAAKARTLANTAQTTADNAASAAAAAVTTAASDATAKMNAAKDAIAVSEGYTNFADKLSKAVLTINGLLNSQVINVDDLFANTAFVAKLVAFSAFIENLIVKRLVTANDGLGAYVEIQNPTTANPVASINLRSSDGAANHGFIKIYVEDNAETGINATLSVDKHSQDSARGAKATPGGILLFSNLGLSQPATSEYYQVFHDNHGFYFRHKVASNGVWTEYFRLTWDSDGLMFKLSGLQTTNPGTDRVWKDSHGYLKIGNGAAYAEQGHTHTAADVGALATNTIQYFTQAQWAALTQAQKNAVPLALVQE